MPQEHLQEPTADQDSSPPQDSSVHRESSVYHEQFVPQNASNPEHELISQDKSELQGLSTVSQTQVEQYGDTSSVTTTETRGSANDQLSTPPIESAGSDAAAASPELLPSSSMALRAEIDNYQSCISSILHDKDKVIHELASQLGTERARVEKLLEKNLRGKAQLLGASLEYVTIAINEIDSLRAQVKAAKDSNQGALEKFQGEVFELQTANALLRQEMNMMEMDLSRQVAAKGTSLEKAKAQIFRNSKDLLIKDEELKNVNKENVALIRENNLLTREIKELEDHISYTKRKWQEYREVGDKLNEYIREDETPESKKSSARRVAKSASVGGSLAGQY